MNNKRYVVITPVGNIYCNTSVEAGFYYTAYGYPYTRNTEQEEN